MKKSIFLFLAFLASNLVFSQSLDDLILDQDGDTMYTVKYTPPSNLVDYSSSTGEEIYKNLPIIDQIRLDKFFRENNPCPDCPPCSKKPVSTGHRASKPTLVAPMPIINIIGSDYDHVEVINNGEGFKLVVDKKPVIVYQENEPAYPISDRDTDASNPGLMGPNPYPGTYPSQPNPEIGKGDNLNLLPNSPGIGFGGEAPAYLFGVFSVLALMALYFLSKIASRGSTPHTESPTPVAPLSVPTPANSSGKTEAVPTSSNNTRNTRAENMRKQQQKSTEKDTGKTEETPS